MLALVADCTEENRLDIGTINSLGLTMPSPAYLIGMVLFSILGYAAYRFGKTSSRPVVKWIGIALMLFTYLVDETWLLYAIGTALCIGAYLYREQEP